MTNGCRKGKDGEREWAKFLTDRGFVARRSQQYCGTAGDSDVVADSLPFHFEVKRVEALNIHNAVAQAVADAVSGKVPTVAHRKNGKEWLVTMTAEDWLDLVKLVGSDADSDA